MEKPDFKATPITALVSVFLCMLLLAAHALAETVTDASVDDPTVITVETDSAESDQKIKSRIENIFTELKPLRGVTVYVGEGVVILRGEVPNEMAAQQAERLAGRLAGVVTIEDEMNRTLTVADNVRPIVENIQARSLSFIKALPLIGLALLVFSAFAIAANSLARWQTLWKKLAPNAFLADLLGQAVRVMLVILGIITALNLVGASSVITTILGGVGIVGLAIGFAVRDTIENYISSVMLSLRQPFRAKDHVIINDIEGIVVRLTSRATVLITLDGNHIRIPNAAVYKGIILNYSTNPERRFEFELGVDAEDDPVAGMKAGLDAIGMLEFVLTSPEPFALIRTVGDSNIVLTFYAWIDQRETNFGKARSLAIRAAMRVLEKQGFTLPEPIYRLRFDPQINSALQAGLGGSSGGVTTRANTADDEVLASKPDVEDAVLDVSPDRHLEDRVDIEIKSEQSEDLLSENVPHE